MTSPIDILTSYIPPVIQNIAPERRSDLKGTFGTDIELLVNDSDRVRVELNVPRLTFGTRYLEVLWARAYGYFVTYDVLHITPSLDADGNEIIDEAALLERVQPAEGLLIWARERDAHRKTVAPWPDGRPRPEGALSSQHLSPGPWLFDPKIVGLDIAMANRLWLVTLAMLGLHELSHLRLKHYKASGVEAAAMEHEADYAAADWILQGAPASKGPARALGIALAFIVLTSSDAYVGPEGWERHPPGYDRLYRTLERCLEDDNHPAWCFAAHSLALEVWSEETERILEDSTSCKDQVNRLCEVMSRRSPT